MVQKLSSICKVLEKRKQVCVLEVKSGLGKQLQMSGHWVTGNKITCLARSNSVGKMLSRINTDISISYEQSFYLDYLGDLLTHRNFLYTS